MQLQFLLMNSGIQGGVSSLWISSWMSRLESLSTSTLRSWHSWRSGWVHRSREGKEKVGGMGMRNWACYSKSSKQLLPDFSAMDHHWSCISLWLPTRRRLFNFESRLRKHYLITCSCFVYCTVLLKTKFCIVVCVGMIPEEIFCCKVCVCPSS